MWRGNSTCLLYFLFKKGENIMDNDSVEKNTAKIHIGVIGGEPKNHETIREFLDKAIDKIQETSNNERIAMNTTTHDWLIKNYTEEIDESMIYITDALPDFKCVLVKEEPLSSQFDGDTLCEVLCNPKSHYLGYEESTSRHGRYTKKKYRYKKKQKRRRK